MKKYYLLATRKIFAKQVRKQNGCDKENKKLTSYEIRDESSSTNLLR